MTTPLNPHEERPKELVRAINQLNQGNTNSWGKVTLRASQTTTTVTNEIIKPDRAPVLTAGPGTWASTVLRVSAVNDGSFVITHSSEAATDRIVHWHL